MSICFPPTVEDWLLPPNRAHANSCCTEFLPRVRVHASCPSIHSPTQTTHSKQQCVSFAPTRHDHLSCLLSTPIAPTAMVVCRQWHMPRRMGEGECEMCAHLP